MYHETGTDNAHDSVVAKLNDYARFAFGGDTQGENREDFYAEWYMSDKWKLGIEYGQLLSAGKLLITTCYNSNIQYEIWMSSGFIRDRYQNRYFDNTHMYLASCYSLSGQSFNTWLLNHGCSLVFGYMISTDTTSNHGQLGALGRDGWQEV